MSVNIHCGTDIRVADIKAGRVYSADEVEAEMKREFGIWNIKWCIQQEPKEIWEIFLDIFQKNNLAAQRWYTDAVDDVLCKVLGAKKLKIEYI